MGKPIRVLLVEDSEDDALLIIGELKKGGYAPDSERVETREAMEKALSEKAWEIVISDYMLPHFKAPEALRVLKSTGIDIPFIVVSGTIGEDVAVEMMRFGAHDYVMKSNLTRLCAAIERERKEAGDRCRRREAELERDKTIKALKRFKEVTVNREYKMIGLKKEVNKLLQEKGEPSKYEEA